MIIIISVFVLMALAMILLSYFGNRLVVSTRGYIAGEAHWSKAQKNAVLALVKYTSSDDSVYYNEFYNFLDVIDGDRAARETLSSDNPDYQLAYEGFIRGKLHPDEISHMIWLFKRFSHVSFMKEAIGYWTEADRVIDQLKQLAEVIHKKKTEEQFSDADFDFYLDELYQMDEKLTVLEENFSSTINNTALIINKYTHRITLLIMISMITVGGYITVKYYVEINNLNQSLTKAEFKFRSVLDNSRDIIYQMNKEGTQYDYISPSLMDITGYTVEEFLEGGPEFVFTLVHPDDKHKIRSELNAFSNKTKEKYLDQDLEFRLKDKQGNYVWISNKRALSRNENGEAVAIVGNVRDISQNKKYLAELNVSLKEKETLLSEIHHRVKNNLAIISSLIEFQKEEKHYSIDQTLDEIQSRIQSIALVHEKLYGTESFSEINLSDYIDDLTKVISKTYKSVNKQIRVVHQLDSITLNISQAVPFGLIYNELINNAYKHAFKELNSGEISVVLKQENGRAALTISDNGIGLPDDFNIQNYDSLGMTLIKTLTDQLSGDLQISSTPQTTFHITFDLA